jgi:hypothetical protein
MMVLKVLLGWRVVIRVIPAPGRRRDTRGIIIVVVLSDLVSRVRMHVHG